MAYPTLFCTIILTTIVIVIISANDFDPYVMNGGLIAAVAGRDYMIMATDTRLTGATGYDILERYHTHTRLWSVTSTSTATATRGDSYDLIGPNGSLQINLFDELRRHSSPPTSSLRLLRESIHDASQQQQQHHQQPPSPIMVGSVGCQVDCEQLKRIFRSEVRTAMHFGEISIHHDMTSTTTAATHIPIETMATLLSQTLYSRRAFPYGCYCILGGINAQSGMGQVYAYDAIGSHEQLAIACTGTGFELLQPILDRQFNPLTSSATSGSNKRRRHPSSVQVDCPTVEEAILKLVGAYRSVSEREIGVGDHVVFYSIQRRFVHTNDDNIASLDSGGDDDNSNTNQSRRSSGNSFLFPKTVYESKIWTAPLKKH